jgi:hypothetical protein
MIGLKQTAFAVLAGWGCAGIATAALYNRGNGLIYDDVLNITWTQNANLFQTQATSNPNLVTEIINNVSTVNIIGSSHTLTNADFNTSNGAMSWFGAEAWITYLNIQNYEGHSNWRLPIVTPGSGNNLNIYNFQINGTGDSGYNITNPNSELSYMYHVNLRFKSYFDVDGKYQSDFGIFGNGTYNGIDYSNFGQNNVGLVKNLQADGYWYGNDYLPLSTNGFAFFANIGAQNAAAWGDNQFYAWAVLPGDVFAVPLPHTIWLFISGLGLLALKTRARKIT